MATEPMSDEWLAAIRERAERVPGSSFAKTQKEMSQAFFDRASLLDEVERLRHQQDVAEAVMERIQDEEMAAGAAWDALRAENAAMREIVETFANGPEDSSMYLCNYCDEYIGGVVNSGIHTSECPVTKARTLLGQ